jgi:hypothetical protein
MYVHLISPFRTCFNLNTESINNDNTELTQVLQKVSKAFSESNFGECHSQIEISKNSFRKFTTLNKDYASLFSLPIFKIYLSHEFIADVYKRSSDETRQILSQDYVDTPITIKSSHIEIYDNTIGILHVTVHIADADRYFSHSKNKLDMTLSELSSQSVKIINIELVSDLLRKFQRIEKKRKSFFWIKKYSFLNEPGINGFDDVAWSDYPNWPVNVDPLLWTARTVELTESEAEYLEHVLEWANVAYKQREQIIKKNSFYISQYGTNVFYNDSTVSDFLEAQRGMQYFTSLFDVLNDNQSQIYSKLSFSMKSRSFNDVIRKAFELSSFVDYVSNEFSDYMYGLQAMRKMHAEHLYQNYSMSMKIKNVIDRKNSVKSKIDRLFQQRTRFSQRGMEAALFAIGGIALVEVGLAISLAAQSKEAVQNDGVIGLIDGAKLIPADGILGSLLIFIIVLSLFYGFRRR